MDTTIGANVIRGLQAVFDRMSPRERLTIALLGIKHGHVHPDNMGDCIDSAIALLNEIRN